MEDDIQWKMTSNGRLPQMSTVNYLKNYWPDLSQISNLGLCDQKQTLQIFQMKMTSNGKRPQMEDYFK
jgi:hypothetical protein